MEYGMSLHATLLICSAVLAVLGIVFIALTVYFREGHVSPLQVLLETRTFFDKNNFKPAGQKTRWLVLVCLLLALIAGLMAMNEASKALSIL